MCASKILGIEILNEGSGISVDDAVTESQATLSPAASSPCRPSFHRLTQVSSSFPKQKPSRAHARAEHTSSQSDQNFQQQDWESCPRFTLPYLPV